MGKSSRNGQPNSSYVIGRKNFAAITAVEGMKLSASSEERLRRTESLSASERRAETIRAFSKKH